MGSGLEIEKCGRREGDERKKIKRRKISATQMEEGDAVCKTGN